MTTPPPHWPHPTSLTTPPPIGPAPSHCPRPFIAPNPPPRYASLYFCCAIEGADNELLTLELIHRYVELLDKYFGSVRVGLPH